MVEAENLLQGTSTEPPEDWEPDALDMPVDTTSDEKKVELRQRYRAAIKGKSRPERNNEWLVYMAARFKEGGNHLIFLDLRQRSRSRGMVLLRQIARGGITPRQYFERTQTQCTDPYASKINRFGLAAIDVDSPKYRALSEAAVIEALQASKGIDPSDKPLFCRVAAKVWYRFVETLHREYGLPAVAVIRRRVPEESKAEQLTLRENAFETTMTEPERDDWKSQVGLETMRRRS